MPTMPDIELDGQLIHRFVQERDERDFATLVERHGALVAGVCARLLHNRADAEDAFQAVFLVLSRRATAVRRQASLAAWLHGVAVRVCLNERKLNRRRQQRLQEAAEVVREASDTATTDEIRRVLDEELSALPQRLCEVLVLCDLEGRTREEVAQTLSLPKSTVSSRLKRGRELMRKRLARRGLVVAAGGLALAMATTGHAEFVTAALIETTVHNADAFRWGTAAVRASLNTNIVSLAEGVLHAMIFAQWKTGDCFFAILAVSILGGALAPDIMPEWARTASAKPILIEDFKDGDATDGDPRSWVLLSDLGYGNGTLDASTGDLVLTPNTQSDTLIAIADPAFDEADVSLRTRIRNRGLVSPTIHGTGVLINGSVERRSNVDFGIQTDGEVYVTIHDDGSEYPLGNVQTDLNPTIEDVVLQVDLFDGVIYARAWRAGEQMPETALITAASPLAPGGTIGIYANPPSADSSATFRYIYVANSPIVPEPGSRTLCAIGGAFLGFGLLFGGRIRRFRFAR